MPRKAAQGDAEHSDRSICTAYSTSSQQYRMAHCGRCRSGDWRQGGGPPHLVKRVSDHLPDAGVIAG